MSQPFKLFCLSVLLVGCLSSCKNQNKSETSSTVETSVKTTDNDQLDDGEIAGTLISINKLNVVFGDLGISSAQNDQVKQLATDFRNDFLGIAEKSYQMAKGEDFKIRENGLTRGLLKRYEGLQKMLSKKSAAEFDRIYLKVMTDMQNKNLKVITEKLIPETQSPEYKGFLKHTRDFYKRYAARAIELSKTL